mgnify:CR=1 FL=1
MPLLDILIEKSFSVEKVFRIKRNRGEKNG